MTGEEGGKQTRGNYWQDTEKRQINWTRQETKIK